MLAHSLPLAVAVAVHYALNQWEALTRFLDDAWIPVDNNRSESALRVVALGRKNFLFVGNEDGGDHLAGLYSLVATCDAHSVDPVPRRPLGESWAALDDLPADPADPHFSL